MRPGGPVGRRHGGRGGGGAQGGGGDEKYTRFTQMWDPVYCPSIFEYQGSKLSGFVQHHFVFDFHTYEKYFFLMIL